MLAGFDQPLSPARPANGAMNTLPPPANAKSATEVLFRPSGARVRTMAMLLQNALKPAMSSPWYSARRRSTGSCATNRTIDVNNAA